MMKTKPKRAQAIHRDLDASRPEVSQTPGDVRTILWGIASDPKQSGTARVSVCRLLLMDARERDGGETGRAADLNRRRAIALMMGRATN